MCYHIGRGESIMEEMNPSGEFVPEENDIYVPRPVWQVWAARLGVVVVIVCFILYLFHIATGGAI